MVVFVVVGHGDLDGVGAAALLVRGLGLGLGGVRLVFCEPHRVDECFRSVLRSGGVVGVGVVDLGLNDSVFRGVVEGYRRWGGGVRVYWFDHHVWEDEWISGLRGLGFEVVVDRSTCATGVVAGYFGLDDDFSRRLVSSVCSVDLWRWDDPLSPFLFRLTDAWSSEEGLRRVFEAFVKGVLWRDEWSRVVSEYVDEELRGYDRIKRYLRVVDVGGCRIVVAVKYWDGPPHRNFLAQYLLSRYGADIAVIPVVGRGISLRSREVDVRRIAVRLGGGGHPRASGAPIPAGFVRRLLARIYPRLILDPVVNALEKTVSEVGCIRE